MLGSTDFPPNDPGNEYENFSSNHPGGCLIALCDGSVQYVNDFVDACAFSGFGHNQQRGHAGPFSATISVIAAHARATPDSLDLRFGQADAMLG